MLDFTWKLFSETGNIETYLLLKEMENEQDADEDQRDFSNGDSIRTEM